MELKPVTSKMFAEVGFDPTAQRLHIRFHPKKGEAQGAVYEYGDDKTPFTPTHWEALRTAESKGGHFSRHVRSHFPFRVVEAGTAATVN
jgi:hypothetical protein